MSPVFPKIEPILNRKIKKIKLFFRIFRKKQPKISPSQNPDKKPLSLMG